MATLSSISTSMTSPHLDARCGGAQRIERPERCSSTSFFSKSRIKNKNVAVRRSKFSQIVKFRQESAAAAFVFFCDFYLKANPHLRYLESDVAGHTLVFWALCWAYRV
jgi:hypothetical protein